MEYVDVEIGKKETRDGDLKRILLQTYLKIYNETDIYMVQDAPDSMKGSLYLLQSNSSKLIY